MIFFTIREKNGIEIEIRRRNWHTHSFGKQSIEKSQKNDKFFTIREKYLG